LYSSASTQKVHSGGIVEENDGVFSASGYRDLKSFKAARQVYDATVVFCGKFVDKRSRTHDQMVQAARSGVQNIAEGSVAAATSAKTELKLTNVARASLEELILRQRGLKTWAKDSPEALEVRHQLQDLSDASDLSDPLGIKLLGPEEAANTLLCLANQASYLLARQLKTLERKFIEEGGFTERLYQQRRQRRG
jgi:four helix bundle suffix protein